MNVYRSHGTAWFLLCLLGCSQTRSVPSAVSTPEVGPAGSSSANSDAAAGAAAPAARAESASAAGVATGTPAAVPTAASLEPPYDLASDLVARKARAKQDLGGRAAWTVVSDVFLLVFPEGGSTMMTDARGREGERIVRAFLDGRFAQKPHRAVTAYLFSSSAAYQGFCQKTTGKPCISPFGYYEPGDRRILMNGAGLYGTFTHEIVHTFVEADFPEAPTWLNEGIASVFEQPYYDSTGIHGAKNWRYPRLMSGLAAEPGTIRIASLFAMSDETFRGPKEDLHYAFARYLCQWLDTQGKLWPFYQRYRDTFAADPSGVAAFTYITGKSPQDLDPPFRSWLRTL